MEDPMRPLALVAADALRLIRECHFTRDQIHDVETSLLKLRLALRGLLEGASPLEINLAEIDDEPVAVGVGAPECIRGALSTLMIEAMLHTWAARVLFLYGAVAHPNLRRITDSWRDQSDHTADRVADTTQRLRHAREHADAAARAFLRAMSYPRLSAVWSVLMLAADEHLRHARIDAAAAAMAASQTGLSLSLEEGDARRLLEAAERDV